MGSHHRSIARKEALNRFWERVGRANGNHPHPRYPIQRNGTPHHSSITFVPVKEARK